jgi:hypothetical protein
LLREGDVVSGLHNKMQAAAAHMMPAFAKSWRRE